MTLSSGSGRSSRRFRWIRSNLILVRPSPRKSRAIAAKGHLWYTLRSWPEGRITDPVAGEGTAGINRQRGSAAGPPNEVHSHRSARATGEGA